VKGIVSLWDGQAISDIGRTAVSSIMGLVNKTDSR